MNTVKRGGGGAECKLTDPVAVYCERSLSHNVLDCPTRGPYVSVSTYCLDALDLESNQYFPQRGEGGAAPTSSLLTATIILLEEVKKQPEHYGAKPLKKNAPSLALLLELNRGKMCP